MYEPSLPPSPLIIGPHISPCLSTPSSACPNFDHISPLHSSLPPSLPSQGKRAFLTIPVKYTNRKIRDHVHREEGQGRRGGGLRTLDDEETAMLQVGEEGGREEGRGRKQAW